MEMIPVEVWQKILRLAIACPLLLPDEDYNHFRTQTITQVTCTLFAEYKQSERIRTNLRSVCSSWNEFLEEYSNRLVRLSPYLPDGHWPPVKRWDTVVRLEGWTSGHTCQNLCWPSSYSWSSGTDLDIQGKIEATIEDIYLPLLGNRCRAIIHPGCWRRELKRLNHIELLTHYAFAAEGLAVYLLTPKEYTNLRHLQIRLPTLINPSAHIELPSLTKLSILLECVPSGPGIPILPSHIGVWNLPKLHYFELESVYANVWVIEVLNLFLGQVGKTIVRFHLGGSLLKESRSLLIDKVWDFSPSLEYLGIGVYDLMQMPGPPNDHHSPSVNVFVDALQMLWSRQGLLTRHITEFPGRWGSSSLGEVRLDTTWEKLLDEIRQKLQIYTALGSKTSCIGVIAIFDILTATGKGLTDCDGAPFDNEVRGSVLSVSVFQVGLQ